MPKEVRQTTLIASRQRSIMDRSSTRQRVLVQKSERQSGVGPDRHRKKQRDREVDRETHREKVREAERCWREKESDKDDDCFFGDPINGDGGIRSGRLTI
jgi:hypothetical protein